MSEKNTPPSAPPESPMTGRIDYDEVRRLVALLEEKNLSLFELEIEGLKVKIARGLPAQAPSAPSAAAAPPATPAPQTPEAAAAAEARNQAVEAAKGHHLITSPMVGTFYRAPSPNADPFVEVGDAVKKGQTLCIIEAMKLMNEIESDADGIVAAVHAENGNPVEFGQKLFTIKSGT